LDRTVRKAHFAILAPFEQQAELRIVSCGERVKWLVAKDMAQLSRQAQKARKIGALDPIARLRRFARSSSP
jgi:hypothetical protein